MMLRVTAGTPLTRWPAISIGLQLMLSFLLAMGVYQIAKLAGVGV
jgi:hypothetical protein